MLYQLLFVKFYTSCATVSHIVLSLGSGVSAELSEELVEVVGVVDDDEQVGGSIAHLLSVLQVLHNVEDGSNEEAEGTGEGKGEVVVEEIEGDSEISDSTSGARASELSGSLEEKGSKLDEEVKRGEDSVESLIGEFLESIEGAVESSTGSVSVSPRGHGVWA